MNKFILYMYLCLGLIIVSSSCMRQELEEMNYVLAKIPVKIDWSESGIDPEQTGQDDVHRVSFRFFPKDGSKPFELYFESNVYEGYLEVPIGEYTVIAMNESLYDTHYWDNFLTFSDIYDCENVSASMLPYDTVVTLYSSISPHNFYKAEAGESFAQNAHKLATWKMEDLVVSPEVVTRTRANVASKSTDNPDLMVVKMRRMHVDITLIVRMTNMHSVQHLFAAVEGFASKRTLKDMEASEPATMFATLNDRKMESDGIVGRMQSTFRCFGKLNYDSTYKIHLDFILVDGTRYVSPEPLEFEISDIVNKYRSNVIDIELLLPITIELPDVEGDISVDEWGDDEIINIG